MNGRFLGDPGAPAGGAPVDLNGVAVWQAALDEAAQAALLAQVLGVMEAAPPFHPVTRWGRPMSVAMTSAGAFGWWSDRGGYRYRPEHPSGAPWPGRPAGSPA